MRNPAVALLVLLLRAWRAVVSPMYGQVCRYHPSCSAYALSAVETHGAVRGSWLAARRLARCHPWAAGGVDHVPPAGSYRWWGTGAVHDDGRSTDDLPRSTGTVGGLDLTPRPPASRGA